MNIGVDLRALGGDKISGVKVYISSLLEEMFRLDKKNRYFLWWNSLKEDVPKTLKIPKSPRFKLIHTKLSNRKLNLRLSLSESFFLDHFIMESEQRTDKLDLFWMPDPRPVALSEDCKLVTTIHDLSPTLYPQFFSFRTKLWHRLLDPNKIAEKSNRILSVSESTKKDLVGMWHIAGEKITATPLATSLTRDTKRLASVRKKYNLPKDFVLSLSTLEPRKNLKTLIAAFAELKQELKIPHKLVLAGDFDRKIFADPKIMDHGSWIMDHVHLTGFIEEADKAVLYSAANVFCFPSIYEGFGLPPLEAMSCGVPVLAADIPVLHEVCGEAAKFIPPKNVDAWKVALAKLLTDTKLQEEMKKRGCKQAKGFSWKGCAEKTINVFEEFGRE